MSHVDEGALHAYLDGALDEYPGAEAGRVRAHIERCARCAERLEEVRAVRRNADAILAEADAAVELPSLEDLRRLARTGPAAPRARTRALQRWSWAASVVLALGAGWLIRDGRVAPQDTDTGGVAGAMSEWTDGATTERALAPRALDAVGPGHAEPTPAEALEVADASALAARAPEELGAQARGSAAVAARTDEGPEEGDVARPTTVSSRMAEAAAEPVPIRRDPTDAVTGIGAAPGTAARPDLSVGRGLAGLQEERRPASEPGEPAEPQTAAARQAAAARSLLPAEPQKAAATSAPEIAEVGDAPSRPDGNRAETAARVVDVPAPTERSAALELRSTAGVPTPSFRTSSGVRSPAEADRGRAGAERPHGAGDPGSLVVPGLDVVSIVWREEGVTPAGVRVLQRLAGGGTLELIHLPERILPGSLDPPEAGVRELVVARSAGWLVLRAPVSEEVLRDLLRRLDEAP